MKRFLLPAATGLIALLLFLAGIEAIAAAYLYTTTGGWMSARERFASTTNTFVQDVTRSSEDCGYLDTLYPHPYLAFVHHANPPCGMPDVNNIGLFGVDFPAAQRSDRFVLLLTGGSVAAQFAGRVEEGPSYLERILNERYVSPNGQPFEVLNGADGAWKQPQQTILFLLFADAVHAVVTLDGFNEHYMIGTGLRFEYPANNFHSVNPLASERFGDIVARWAVGRLRQSAADNWLLSRSHAAYSLITAAQELVARRIEARPKPKTTVESLFLLPQVWPEAQRKAWALEQYRKYIRAMQAIAANHGVRTAFFLQPVPAIGKQLTPEERRVVGDLGYRPVYADLAANLTQMNAEGVPVISLLNLFEREQASVYSDPIHLARTVDGVSYGYEFMAGQVADELGRLWKLTPRARP